MAERQDTQGLPMSFLQPPDKLDMNSKNLPQVWKKWKEELNLYMDLAMENKAEKLKIKMFLYLVGSHGREIHDTLTFDTAEENRTLNEVLTAFDTHCDPKKNETVERYKFFTHSQESGESFDKYVTELKILASTCNFENLQNSLIRDRVVCGICDVQLRERLLRETDLTLDKCVHICRASEISKQQSKTLESPMVHAVKQKPQPSANRSKQKQIATKRGQTTQQKRRFEGKCKYCGFQHEFKRDKCPAWGKECTKCKTLNHFAKMCTKGVKEVYLLEDADETDDFYEIKSVTLHPDVEHINQMETKHPKQIYATMLINNEPVKFQVDCGATCNIIPRKLLGNLADYELRRTEQVLSMYNKTTVKPMGCCKVNLTNPKDSKRYRAEFVVLDNPDCVPLLGSRASQQMDLVKIQFHNILAINTSETVTSKPVSSDASLSTSQLLSDYADVFEGTGLVQGKYHIVLDPNIQPVVHPPRKVPVALKGKLKEELDRLTELNVITPVSKPTPWVSSLVTVMKPNKMRICIDPKDLNRAIQRSHYPFTTIEEILPDLSNAKVFSKFDARNGYWHVELDEDSSYLTTFNTPFGRYRWLRLPFGINSAPEEFQRRLDQALEGLPGVKSIVDDILVYGVGDTMELANADHDRKVCALLQRCRDQNIKLNKDKIELRASEVPFIGHLITANGLKPDPDKVRAVTEMPEPKDVPGVQRLLGFVNYLHKFLPKLSEICEPLRKLTVKDTEWHWTEQHGEAINTIKKLIVDAPVLKYYNKDEELTLQCDASESGLGAALLQNGQPIAFASRALTDTETRYAQIEKELLAVVFGMEKFHQYTYGRPVTVQSDHKPLEVIVKKTLNSAPKRLQRMLLRLQTYDIDLIYCPGKTMYLADTLSRAPLPETQSQFAADVESVNMVQYLPISEPRLRDIQQHTSMDPSLQSLKEVIQSGWPEDKDKVPASVMSYYNIRDELSMQNGIIFRGERAVIPKSLRHDMLQRIHSSHIGIEGCCRRARECLYWPGMNSEVKDFIQKCDTCNTLQNQQQKETLHSHDVPHRPWAKVATDLFSFSGKDYLVTVDYFSNFWEVDYLEDTASTTVIRKLKSHFSRYGIPDICVSDNGPQYSSDEFRKFAFQWDFEHVTSSPGYPQSNGKAEEAVASAKRLMRKSKHAESDPYLAMLDFRNTPTQGMKSSPAQRLMSRRTKNLLPMSGKLLLPKIVDNASEELKADKHRQALYYNQHAKDLPSLQPGQTVRLKPAKPHEKQWKKATVQKQLDHRSYEIVTEDNRVYRRNRRHLRASCENNLPNQTVDDTYGECTTETQPAQHMDIPSSPVVPPQSTTTVQTTRSGRTVKMPKFLKDYHV